MALLVSNRVRVRVATIGTGTVTFGLPFSNLYLSPSEAGAVDGDQPFYLFTEGLDFELGVGTIVSSVGGMDRDRVLVSKIGGIVGTTKMTLAGLADLRFVDPAEVHSFLRQIVMTSGTIYNMLDSDVHILINKSVSSPTTVNLVSAANRLKPIHIVDMKLDAGTNPITIVPNGAETIRGLSSWVLDTSGASVTFYPYPDGTGWYTTGTDFFDPTILKDSDIGVSVQAHSAVLDGTTASFTIADETKLDGIEVGADATDAVNVDAAGAVMESDFGVQTILAAALDNTPLPLTVSASTIVGRAATGDIAALTAAQVRTIINVEDGATADQSAAEILAALLTVDGTGSGLDADLLDGNSIAAFQLVDPNLTTLAGLTPTTDNFIQSKASAWASRTPTQVTADLINFVGDAGAGGTKGLVPAPAAGDAAASKFLSAAGTWTAPSGSGDVVGPASSVDGRAVLFDGITGKLLKSAAAAPFLVGGAASDVSVSPAVLGASNAQAALTAIAAALPSSFFHVHKNGTNQTAIPSATDTALTWATEVADEGGLFDLGNNEVTPSAGFWLFVARATFVATGGNIVDQESYSVRIYKDSGGGYALDLDPGSVVSSGSGANHAVAGAIILQTDGISSYKVYVQGRGAGDKIINGGVNATYWMGIRLKP